MYRQLLVLGSYELHFVTKTAFHPLTADRSSLKVFQLIHA